MSNNGLPGPSRVGYTADMVDMSRREKKALRDQRSDLQGALGHEGSRRVIRRLLDVAGLFTGYEGEFERGKRSVALWLVSEINGVDPHAFPKLLQEAVNDRVKEEVVEQDVD